MQIIQNKISIEKKNRGFHIITQEIERKFPEMNGISKGIAHIHIMHTSASLSLNENADPSVRYDMENFFSAIVPEDDISKYEHTSEGADDMTSHIKNAIIGSSITLPVTNGQFNLGVWQGIYLCEHRNQARSRNLIITIIGEK